MESYTGDWGCRPLPDTQNICVSSITLSKEVLTRIDRVAGSKQSRSAFIEAVLTQYLRKRARAQVEARDLELINQAADELNVEVEDILRYQDPDA